MALTQLVHSKMIPAIMALAMGVVLTGITAEAQATVIDNTGGASIASGVGAFGEPNAATWGQVITLNTVETQLDSFSFHVSPINLNEDVFFSGYVSAWDSTNEHAIGPVLYTGTPRTALGSDLNYQTFTFNTGGLNLTQGQPYILYLSASSYFAGGQHLGNIGSVDADPADSGEIYFIENGNDLSQLTTSSWTHIPEANLAYQASISDPGVPTPEPATAALAVMSLAGLVVTIGRRRQLA